jgi:hypothetical protein
MKKPKQLDFMDDLRRKSSIQHSRPSLRLDQDDPILQDLAEFH